MSSPTLYKRPTPVPVRITAEAADKVAQQLHEETVQLIAERRRKEARTSQRPLSRWDRFMRYVVKKTDSMYF